MNHFLGSRNAALATDENNSPPIPLLHPRDVRAAEAHATEHIDFEDLKPIFVGNCVEGFGFIYSEVVDENVHGGKMLQQVFRCRS